MIKYEICQVFWNDYVLYGEPLNIFFCNKTNTRTTKNIKILRFKLEKKSLNWYVEKNNSVLQMKSLLFGTLFFI